jgi:Dolichyl-phosphate-mannose-protein mannosyltransferase
VALRTGTQTFHSVGRGTVTYHGAVTNPRRPDLFERIVHLPTTTVMAAILALATALRIAFFTGYHGFDDVYYIQRAFDLSEGVRTLPQSAWQARIGLVGPTALVYAAFGVTPVTTSLFPFACSLLGICAAYALGKRLFDERTGLLAALLLAFLPIDVLFAGQLFANTPVSLLAGMGLGCFVLAERNDDPRAYVASGLCMGLAAVVHEAAVMVLAAYPAYLLAVRGFRVRHFLLAGAFVFGLSVEPITHWLLLGAPLARLQGLAGSHSTSFSAGSSDLAYSGFNVVWIGEGLVRPFFERTFGLFTWLLMPALWLAVRCEKRSVERALGVVVVAAASWILFGTVSPTHYSPLWRLPRYLVPLALPATWLLARWLMQTPRARRGVLLAALGVSSVACLMVDSGSALVPYQRAQKLVATQSPSHVVVDRASRFPLMFAERMRPRYTLADFTSGQVAPGTLLLVQDPRLREQLASASSVKFVAELQAPTTMYLRVLRMRLVMDVLRATRPPERFAEYAAKLEPMRLGIYSAR